MCPYERRAQFSRKLISSAYHKCQLTFWNQEQDCLSTPSLTFKTFQGCCGLGSDLAMVLMRSRLADDYEPGARWHPFLFDLVASVGKKPAASSERPRNFDVLSEFSPLSHRRFAPRLTVQVKSEWRCSVFDVCIH